MNDAAQVHDFDASVLSLHDAEYRGAGLFDAIAQNATNADDQAKMLLLTELERTMQHHIAQWLGERRVPVVPPEFSRDDLAAHYGDIVDDEPRQFIARYQPVMERVCDRLREWEAGAPEHGAAIARDIVGHDVAILEFMNRELAGRTHESTQPITDFLERLGRT